MNRVAAVVTNRANESNKPKYLTGMKLANSNIIRPAIKEMLESRMGLPVSSNVWESSTAYSMFG